MNIKISVIIPVYNTEQFLRCCFDSCLAQTLEEIEIIAVNDASPDCSDVIMQEYENKYPEKMRCIYLKENIRQGGARNAAIRCARGEFLMFVDSDDWIKPEMCEKLYSEAQRSKADIVYCNLLEERKDGYLISNRFPDEAAGNVDENIVELLVRPSVMSMVHIIRKQIIVQNNLYYPEGILMEDLAITKLWAIYAERIAKIEGAYYVYRLNLNSTMRGKWTEYRGDEMNSIKLLYDNLMQCEKLDGYHTICSLICMQYALDSTKAAIRKGGRRFEAQIKEDFTDCITYVCGGLADNGLLKRWFTPIERQCLLEKKINFDYYDMQNQKDIVGDYKRYYQNLCEEIKEILEWFRVEGRTKTAIWGKMNCSSGLKNAFPDMVIIDKASEVDKSGIEVVICLRIAHVANAKKQLCEKNVELFNLQGYLESNGAIEKFRHKMSSYGSI